MAAQVKITANTTDAQQKVQRLRKEVERLDREARKPKKIRVQGGTTGRLSGIGSNDLAKATAKGNLMADSLKSIVALVVRGLAPVLGRIAADASGQVDKFGTLGARLEKYLQNLSTYVHPEKEALERADRMDALDDERRSHNSKSIAEEMAYSRAFTQIAGVNGNAIVDRLQALLDMATSGNFDDMEKAWGKLQGFGLTWQDLQDSSTWEVLAKMLDAYKTAGADGQNELTPAMQEIVGVRNMGAIRKAGEGEDLRTRAQRYEQEFNTRIPPEMVQRILEAADASEAVRIIAEIEGLKIPDSAMVHVTNAANQKLDTAENDTRMLTTNGDAAALAGEMLSELLHVVQLPLDLIETQILERFPGLRLVLGKPKE